jgi:monovalent cation/hydrogen antiporter
VADRFEEIEGHPIDFTTFREDADGTAGVEGASRRSLPVRSVSGLALRHSGDAYLHDLTPSRPPLAIARRRSARGVAWRATAARPDGHHWLMHMDLQDGLVALCLLLAVATLLAAAPTLRIPYPILLVIGGLALGLVPGIPEFELEPELVFFGILPPLLYGAAFFTSLRDLRASVRPIGLLAVGLVVFTTVGVAVVAHSFIDDLSWGSAFVLGAIVSPTDPLAATSIASRFGVPRKLVTIVEGESLVNDGTGLVLFRVAVAAVVAGSFSAFYTGGLFVVSVGGGVAVGCLVGWLVRQVRLRLDNPPAEITISLLTGYIAFIPAELMGVSAVLATVTAGIYLGWHTPELTNAQVRIQAVAVWEIVQYLLNALLFVLVGLQLPVVIDALGEFPAATLIGYGALVSVTVIALRFAWVFAVLQAPKWVARRVSSWRGAVFVSWAGMRGAVSLAAALALPLTTDDGDPFAGRELILFLTFSVILVTLVGMGLTLPLVIRLLGFEDDGMEERENAKARIHAAEAALARLEELLHEEWVRDDTAERLRGAYRFRTSRFRGRLDNEDDGTIESRSQDYQRLRRELLEAERQALVQLRRSGVISNDVWIRVARDLDLEELRLDI